MGFVVSPFCNPEMSGQSARLAGQSVGGAVYGVQRNTVDAVLGVHVLLLLARNGLLDLGGHDRGADECVKVRIA